MHLAVCHLIAPLKSLGVEIRQSGKVAAVIKPTLDIPNGRFDLAFGFRVIHPASLWLKPICCPHAQQILVIADHAADALGYNRLRIVKDHFTRYPVDVTQGTMHASQKRCHVQRRDELHVTNPRPRQREREAIEGEFRTVDRDPPHVSPIYLGLFTWESLEGFILSLLPGTNLGHCTPHASP